MQRWERSLRSLAGAAAGGIAKAVLAHRLRHATEHGERVAIVSDELDFDVRVFRFRGI
jgi:hypothetical protein